MEDDKRAGKLLGLAVALHLPLAVGFAVGVVRELLSPLGVLSTDFSVFWSAWWLILHGRGHLLYDQAAQRAAQHVVMGGLEFQGGLMAFLNPPHAALAGVPLGWLADRLGERAALGVWIVVNALLLFRLVRLVLETLDLPPGRARWATVLALLGFFPVFYTMSIGQFSIALAVAVFELYRALLRDQPWGAAAWMAVLSIKPQLLPPLLLFLIVRRRWDVLARAAVLGAAIVALTALVLGPSIWLDYFRQVRALERFFATGTPAYMMNVRGALTRLFGGVATPDTVFACATTIWMAGMAAVGAALARRPGDVRSDYALVLALALLGSPHLFAQDTVLWIPALTLHAAALRERGDGASFSFAVFALSWPVLFSLARIIDLGGGEGPVLRVDPTFIIMLIAFGFIARDRRRR